MRHKVRALIPLSAVLLLSGLVLAACGGGSKSGGEGGGSDSGSTGAAQLAAVNKIVKGLFTKEGTFSSPPTTAPKPKAGTNVWLISCGQSISICSHPIGAAEEAAASLGWNSTTFDDKGEPAKASEGIRSAIADHADVIYDFYIDCRYIQGALKQAKAAGILLVGADVTDCGESNAGSENLFDYITTYSGNLTKAKKGEESYLDHIRAWGASLALWSIQETEGHADALIYQDNVGYGDRVLAHATLEAYEKYCPECEAEIIVFPYSALETGMQERVRQDLLKNPKVNVLNPTYDTIAIAGLVAGAEASGRDLLINSGEGDEAGVNLTREGKLGAGSGWSLEWDSWAALDAANRLMNGEEPQPTGMGLQMFDKERNLGPSGPWNPPYDYAAIYKKAFEGGEG